MPNKALLVVIQGSLFVNRISFSVALLAFALTSPGHAKEAPLSFEHDGVTYTYTVNKVSDTSRVIKGKASNGGDFNLFVSNGRVTGRSNGNIVSFRLKDVKVNTVAASNPLVVAAR